MFETSKPTQKTLSRFWIEISVIIIVLAFVNGIILGLIYTTHQKAVKAMALYSESHVRLALIVFFMQNKEWPTLPELKDKMFGNFIVDPSYEGLLANISGKSFFIPTYANFTCSQKTRYFPAIESYVHCVGRAFKR